MMPPLALIFLVLGTIFLGIATPTEGGAMGSTGALHAGLAQPPADLKLMNQAMDTTAKLSSFVVFILIGSTVFSLVFRGVNGDLWVEHLLTSLPGGQVGFLDRGQRARILPGLLPRFFRACLHHRAAAGRRWRRSSAST